MKGKYLTKAVAYGNLSAFLEQNQVAGDLFLHLANRSRNADCTKSKSVENLFSKKGITRPEVTEVWEILEFFKCGRFIEGRKGHESRFEWHVKTMDYCSKSILSL